MSPETHPALSVLGMMIAAPIVGMHPDHLDVVHAVTFDAYCDAVLGKPPVDWITAPCGAQVKALMFGSDEGARVFLWPPYVRPLREQGKERCRACWEATGKKRPRTAKDGES